jgi:hypothetical protein
MCGAAGARSRSGWRDTAPRIARAVAGRGGSSIRRRCRLNRASGARDRPPFRVRAESARRRVVRRRPKHRRGAIGSREIV